MRPARVSGGSPPLLLTFEEHLKGIPEHPKPADPAVLSGGCLSVPDDGPAGLTSLPTVAGGHVVRRDPEFDVPVPERLRRRTGGPRGLLHMLMQSSGV
ncbi:hypothetical protein QCN29_13710 [Streptomyces sp. HNM0663]|uniref:Uncharacterized protein n=1 Tax=Streptomyces chengmaiensis TaxID=3040919 RepID=A0ABT6HM75_9ACTN|nr:hypothetical protein [Streptomyces chengmaiensis]MDH2389831.1 hypothetical protein [Streptomyces chengmaiensis]